MSAEDDLVDGEEDDDELDASVETDEGIVSDDVPLDTGHTEAVSESDAEKVSPACLCLPHFVLVLLRFSKSCKRSISVGFLKKNRGFGFGFLMKTF